MQEKRQFQRFEKKYTVIYTLKDNPTQVFDLAGLLDISKGGLKFSSHEAMRIGQEIDFQIKFPFLYPLSTPLSGKVINVSKLEGSYIYRISVKFISLNSNAMIVLNEMEKINQKK